MIPNASDRKLSGNLPGEKVAMTFDENSLAHIMSILTDLYSDPEQAIIREYTTNARDSHIEAGNSDPIEVFLPTPLSPYLKIVDHGIGLSVDDIHAIYSKYGASTKRGSNNSTGMLGVGCKAALTYSAQFTLVAVKDGVRVTVAVSRDEDGAGSMTIVDTSQTSEPNGVEVSIPAKSGNQIEAKAKAFFRFWRPGTVLVNGKEPAHIEGLQITPEIMLCKSNAAYYGHHESYVVMGNVPYPSGEQLSAHTLDIPFGYHLVVQVPIGSVDFAPSREQLQFTNRTKTTLANVYSDFKNGLVKAVQKEIEEAASRPAALKALHAWKHFIRGHNFNYRDQDIPTSIVAPKVGDGTLQTTNASNYRLGSASKLPAVDLNYMANAVFILNYTPAKLTPTHKKKMLQWLAKQNLQVSNFILTNFKFDTSWLEPARLVDWSVISAEQLPKQTISGNPSRLPGSYDVVIAPNPSGTKVRQKAEVPGDEIDFTNPVYYMHGNILQGYSIAKDLAEFCSKFTLICLPANRIQKFTRDNPKIEKVEDVLQSHFEKWTKALTKDQKLAIQVQTGYYMRNSIPPSTSKQEILDPDVRNLMDAQHLDIKALLDQYRLFRNLGFDPDEQDWENPMDNYPLFNKGFLLESIEYMNMVYEKRNK